MENLVILAHVTGRTFVLPGHISSGIDHLEQYSTVEDFYDFEHIDSWLRLITMQQYLDVRYAWGTDPWAVGVYRHRCSSLGPKP